MESKGFFSGWNHHKCLKMYYSFSAGTVFKRQNLISTDVWFWRIKTVPALKRWNIFCINHGDQRCCKCWRLHLKISFHPLEAASLPGEVTANTMFINEIHGNTYGIILAKRFATQNSLCNANNHQHFRPFHPIMFYCWASVADKGPTLKQHWVNMCCCVFTTIVYLLMLTLITWMWMRSDSLCHSLLSSLSALVCPQNTCFCWFTTQKEPTQHPSRHKTSNLCWFKVGPPSTTLDQLLPNINSASFVY